MRMHVGALVSDSLSKYRHHDFWHSPHQSAPEAPLDRGFPPDASDRFANFCIRKWRSPPSMRGGFLDIVIAQRIDLRLIR